VPRPSKITVMTVPGRAGADAPDVITVATWNVLHRVHAVNYGEETAARWPDEHQRIAAVTALLAGRAEQVIALQEVSGDQLVSLRAGLPGRAVHAFRYPRVPVPRRGPSPLRDRDEYLVLLMEEPGWRAGAWAFDDDPGKGALVVHAAGMLFASVHVSWSQRGPGQLARLAGLADAWTGYPVVLLGDFNADRAAVAAGLGSAFTVAWPPPGTRPTRPGASGTGPLFIDHVAARGARVSAMTVEDAGGLSDHDLVRADISPEVTGTEGKASGT
jgi:endonuclease/exonuclease/phosphatase (EEP) superfamily protein YafD